jgi:hypothetical protein
MARELFRELDRDKNDEVSFEEFFSAHYEEPVRRMWSGRCGGLSETVSAEMGGGLPGAGGAPPGPPRLSARAPMAHNLSVLSYATLKPEESCREGQKTAKPPHFQKLAGARSAALCAPAASFGKCRETGVLRRSGHFFRRPPAVRACWGSFRAPRRGTRALHRPPTRKRCVLWSTLLLAPKICCGLCAMAGPERLGAWRDPAGAWDGWACMSVGVGLDGSLCG